MGGSFYFYHKNHGVTIAELSIVLVIIGLLVSVVAIGLNVQKSSQVQGFIVDIQQFQVAIEGFEQQYGDLPGDMADAYDYWGDNCDATASNCNGDGDSEIDLTAVAADNESYRAWQHLRLTGLVDGGFSGEGGGTGAQADVGINVPVSDKIRVGYVMWYGRIIADDNRNEIRVGAYRTNTAATNSAFTPSEAYLLDRKTDDGSPGGMVNGSEGADAAVNSCVSVGNTYVSSDAKTIACVMSFPIFP